MHCAYVYSEFLVDESSIDEILWGYGETSKNFKMIEGQNTKLLFFCWSSKPTYDYRKIMDDLVSSWWLKDL